MIGLSLNDSDWTICTEIGIVGGIVKNSCNSPGACYKVASSKDEEDFSDHRFIAGIVNGCNAEKVGNFSLLVMRVTSPISPL